jgi:alkylated DNA nucleotide flippase Atl1
MAANDGDKPGYGLGSSQMGPGELPEFAEAVLSIVDRIPVGMVLAYGDIAEMLGQGGPRQVGAVMSRYGSSVTWWRVIRATGEVPHGLLDEALAHWREEGTALLRGVISARRVDMRLARWDGKDPDGLRTEMAVQRIGDRPLA